MAGCWQCQKPCFYKMILSDSEIKQALKTGKIHITPPPGEKQFDTSSLDLRLGDQFKRYKEGLVEQSGVETTIDPSIFDYRRMSREYMEVIPLNEGSIVLKPEALVLAMTLEKIHLPRESKIAARIEGRSTLARIGISVHLTAPTIQLGFLGNLVLEIKNHGKLHVRLAPGMIICQLIFERVGQLASRDIGTSHQGQVSP